jgi:hypothetical protein
MFFEVPQVPNLVPKEFPIAPQFYPIWFAQSSTLMYINWKGRLFGEYNCIYFATGGPTMSMHWGVLNVPKKLLMGLMNMALSHKHKKKNEYGSFAQTQKKRKSYGQYEEDYVPNLNKYHQLKQPTLA